MWYNLIKQITKLFFFTMLIFNSAYPQLKDMVVEKTVGRSEITTLSEYRDKAAIVFYSSFQNLSFSSTYGIHKVFNPNPGIFIVVIEPTRQTLDISTPQYKTEMLKVPDLKPNEILYYTVEPSKNNQSGGGFDELAVTFQIEPGDSQLFIDEHETRYQNQVKLALGKHNIKVVKDGYRTFYSEIEVSPSTTLFSIRLEQAEVVPVTVTSLPLGARIFIDGVQKGSTKYGFFCNPGKYRLKLELPDYLPIEQDIFVKSDGSNNDFSYTLTRNKGTITVKIITSGATVDFNNETLIKDKVFELTPGYYAVQATASGYYPLIDTVQVELGKDKVYEVRLNSSLGILNLNIIPTNANVTLDSKVITSFSNIMLSGGKHTISVEADKYFPITKDINIEINKTVTEAISLEKNTGTIDLQVNPSSAVVKVNNEVYDSRNIELSPGIYKIEVSKETYYTEAKTINLKLHEKSTMFFSLKRKVGNARFIVNPPDAECILTSDGQEYAAWSGLKIINAIPEGNYSISVKLDGYKSTYRQIYIKPEETSSVEIELEEGSDKNSGPSYGSIHLLMGIPILDLSATSSTSSNPGFATVGFGAMYEYSNKLFFKKYLNYVLSTSYMNLGTDAASINRERFAYWNTKGATITLDNYKLLSGLFGFRLYKNNETFSPFIAAQYGFVYMLSQNYSEGSKTCSIASGLGTGYSVTLGVKIVDLIDISLRYTDAKVNRTAIADNSEFKIISAINLLQLTFGVEL